MYLFLSVPYTTELFPMKRLIYRRYKALHRQTIGDYFFKETEDLVEKLCDDFERTVEGR